MRKPAWAQMCAAFSVCVFCCAYFAPKLGYRVNLSYSVPIGIWKAALLPGTAKKGDYAVVPPEAQPQYRLAVERGYISDGDSLLKKVVAVAEDVVDYDTREGLITVNGQAVFHTKIFSADSAGQPLPETRFPVHLSEGRVWLSSENINGFDSRYFGPVSGDWLIQAVPVVLF